MLTNLDLIISDKVNAESISEGHSYSWWEGNPQEHCPFHAVLLPVNLPFAIGFP
jgi:hypothetical protein